MGYGTLEVLLVGAKGLENTDYLCNMDPYVILSYRSQEQKSSVASGKGSEPEWNENFVFTISDKFTELRLKITDSDAASADDFVGEAIIPMDPLFTEGSIPATAYNVVKDQEYRGQIRLAFTFTPTGGPVTVLQIYQVRKWELALISLENAFCEKVDIVNENHQIVSADNISPFSDIADNSICAVKDERNVGGFHRHLFLFGGPGGYIGN